MRARPARIIGAAVNQAWKCPGCRKVARSEYCARCGEKRLRPRDLTFADIGSQFAKGISSVDGKLFRSVRALLGSPGSLTAAYVTGKRKPFISPVALFLVCNAVFFAVQSLTNAKILSSSLSSHLHNQDWSELAQRLVANRLAATGRTSEAYAPIFDAAAVFNAKTLIVMMVLAFAPISAVIFKSRQMATGAHVVFALHLYAFVLVLLSVSLLIAHAELLLGGGGLDSALVDNALSIFNLVACGAYIYLALKPAYDTHGLLRLFQAVVLATCVAVILIGYRSAIFLITLYSS